jgi:8-oxo-dGTP diphosphatase
MITVINAFAVSKGKVLLVQKGEFWILPGGKLEPDETDGEGLHREFHEELPLATLHIQVALGKVIGLTPGSGQRACVYIYGCSVEGDITPAAEIATAGWFTLLEARLLPLSPITQAILTQHESFLLASKPLTKS